MIEVIIGLVAVLALFAGLVQISSLAKAQNECLAEARRQAGASSLTGTMTSGTPDYIGHWNNGQDERPYTRDDRFDRASMAAFQAVITDKAVAAPADWPLLDSMPHNYIARLRRSQWVTAEFGLVGVTERRTVPLLPAVQDLLYDKADITVECDVWTAWTKGIY